MSIRNCRVCKKEIEAITMGTKTCIECLNKTMTLEEEITELSKQWMHEISDDHHKDRDCHWYIKKIWSYGEEPYYQAYHNGYILNSWISPKVATEELAMTLLCNKLKKELDNNE